MHQNFNFISLGDRRDSEICITFSLHSWCWIKHFLFLTERKKNKSFFLSGRSEAVNSNLSCGDREIDCILRSVPSYVHLLESKAVNSSSHHICFCVFREKDVIKLLVLVYILINCSLLFCSANRFLHVDSTSSPPKKRTFFSDKPPTCMLTDPQALQSGINLSRQTEQHYSLATQILVSHSNDESLPHTMSSVINPPITSVPLNSLMCYRDQDSQDPPVLPDCASCNMDKQLGPTTSLYSASLLCSTQIHTHTHTYPQTTNLNSTHPTVHFLTAHRNIFKL